MAEGWMSLSLSADAHSAICNVIVTFTSRATGVDDSFDPIDKHGEQDQLATNGSHSNTKRYLVEVEATPPDPG